MDSVRILKLLGLYRCAQGLRNRRLRPSRLRFFSRFIAQGYLCFDVGANIGSRTGILLELGAKVVAIEPQDEPFDILTKHYGRNKDLIAIKKGLGSKEETTEMFLCYDDGCYDDTCSSMSQEWIAKVKHSGRFPKGYNWNRRVTVHVTTLDALIASYGVPKFCKIDVEGYEYEVIQGLSRAIPVISFEYTPEVIETSFSVMAYLAGLGDYEYNYVKGESTAFLMEKWVDAATMKEYLDGLRRRDICFGDVYARLKGN